MSSPQSRGNEDRHQFLRSAGVVSAAVALSRITGVVREVVMARLFGAGAANDAFQIAFRIPNLTRNLFAEGALSSAFVPVFTKYLQKEDGRPESAELFQLVATALVMVAGAVCAAGMIFAPQLVGLLAPGFAGSPEKFALAVLLTRVMFPFLVLVALSAQAMGALNACDRFGIPALASTFFNLGSVASGLAVGFTIGQRSAPGLIVSMAVGVLAGGALQLLWQAPSLWRAGFRYRIRVNWSHPGLRQILGLMAPALVGSAAVQINLMVNSNLASGITDAAGRVMDGPVSWLAYAFRFLQLPLGLFGVSIATATLPAISRSASVGQMDEFRATTARSVAMTLLLSIPSSVGLAVLGESMIGAVYQGGRFTAFDTHQTAVALAWYSVGLAGYSATKVLAPAFYALNDGKTPALVSVASIALNFVMAYGLVRWAGMGHAGLALSTSLVALAGGAALFELLRRRAGGMQGGHLAASTGKIAAASAVMGAVCFVVNGMIHGAAGNGRAANLLDVAVSVPLGLAVFYFAARILRLEELDVLRQTIWRDKAGAAASEEP